MSIDMTNMVRTKWPAVPGGENEVSICPPVDVMLVDHRAVVRAGLCALIERQADLVVVAQAASLGDAARLEIAPRRHRDGHRPFQGGQ